MLGICNFELIRAGGYLGRTLRSLGLVQVDEILLQLLNLIEVLLSENI